MAQRRNVFPVKFRLPRQVLVLKVSHLLALLISAFESLLRGSLGGGPPSREGAIGITLFAGAEDPFDCPKLPAAIGKLSADAGGKLDRLVSARLGSDPGEELSTLR